MSAYYRRRADGAARPRHRRCQCRRCGILPHEDTEPGHFKARAGRLLRIEKADAGRPRPTVPVMRRTAWPRGDLLQAELATGFEHAVHLGIKPVTVGDVHRYVLRPHHIEAHILERQVECTPLPVIDPADEPGQPSQHFGNPDEFGGQIDATDPAAVMPRDKSRGPSE